MNYSRISGSQYASLAECAHLFALPGHPCSSQYIFCKSLLQEFVFYFYPLFSVLTRDTNMTSSIFTLPDHTHAETGLQVCLPLLSGVYMGAKMLHRCGGKSPAFSIWNGGLTYLVLLYMYTEPITCSAVHMYMLDCRLMCCMV